MPCAECDALKAERLLLVRQIGLLAADRDRLAADRLRSDKRIQRIRDIVTSP